MFFAIMSVVNASCFEVAVAIGAPWLAIFNAVAFLADIVCLGIDLGLYRVALAARP